MLHSIYLVTNNVNGKVYIGQTKRKDRWYHHVWEAQKGRKNKMLLHKAIRKYGAESFTYEVLVSGVPAEKVNDYERMFIESFNSTDSLVGYNYLSYGSAYNGQMNGEKHPNFGKKNEKLAEFNKSRKGIPSSGAQKTASSLANKNVPKSDSHREKISISRKRYCEDNKQKLIDAAIKGNAKRIGKSFKNKLWRKVLCIETDKIYENATLAGVQMGFGKYAGGNIRSQANGILKTAYGHTFKFIEPTN
jgi:group I intron endonuclease